MSNLPSLYSISTELAALLESDEPDSLERLDALLPTLHQKAAGVAAWIEYTEDLANALKDRAAKVMDAAKAMEGRAAKNRAYLLACMEAVGAERITDDRTGRTITVQRNPPAVVVDDEEAIPKRFWVPQPPPKPQLDKRAVAKVIKNGDTVPGAHLEQGTRLVIK